ncbi:hypothetical protein BP5796_05277 [Coleophoma crateriformis]|uniref:Mid2 domain-containing protein n=1 Tax=Coleophoma crateriformis TaxID=565419 RepID=A0A3D8S2R8_9HELO|nr:hypothetical protein BP5796_05277 [Coleophoma crateriformis]
MDSRSFSRSSPILRLLFLLSLAFTTATALPWPGPKPTSTYLADEWTPRPTSTSSDVAAQLLKKASVPVEVCGWIGGDFASPAVCNAGSSCIHDTAHAVVGCCTTSGPCLSGVYTTCVDYNSVSQGTAGQSGILSCTGTSVCNQNTYMGNYHQYQCGASALANTIATMYSGQASDFLLQIVYTGVSFGQDSMSSTATSTNTSTSVPTSTAASSVSSVSTSSTDTPTPQASGFQASSRQTKNIVIGSIVGGVSGLFAIAGLLYFCIGKYFYRNRREAATQEEKAGPFESKYESTASNLEDPNPDGQSDDSVVPVEMSGCRDPPHPGVYPAAYRTVPPATRLNTNIARSDSPPQESTPLFSEIDEFSRNWNDAMNLTQTSSNTSSQDPVIQRDSRSLTAGTEAKRRTGTVPASKTVGLRGGEGGSPRSPGRSRWIRTPSSRENVRREGWSPAPLQPKTPPPPPRDPRRMSNQHSQRPSRYELVRTSPPSTSNNGGSEYEDVPIMESPTRLMRDIGRAL